jgi:hypothetical protein
MMGWGEEDAYRLSVQRIYKTQKVIGYRKYLYVHRSRLVLLTGLSHVFSDHVIGYIDLQTGGQKVP